MFLCHNVCKFIYRHMVVYSMPEDIVNVLLMLIIYYFEHNLCFSVVVTGPPNRTAPYGARCMFPFTEYGVTFNGCTQQYTHYGAWCKTEGDVKYGYCYYRKCKHFLIQNELFVQNGKC